MKISELKKLIRQNIIQELSESNADLEFDSFVTEKKDKEEDVEITADETDTVEEPTADTPSPEEPALSDSDQEYLNTLEDLKNKAKEMGDEKLENQIDNTITYFTRQHVVKEGALEESISKGDQYIDPVELEQLAYRHAEEAVNNIPQYIFDQDYFMLYAKKFAQNFINFAEMNKKVNEFYTPDPSPIRENYEMRRLQRIAGLIK